MRLHQTVVNDGLRDTAGGKDGVEFTALAQVNPVVGNVLNYGILVLSLAVLRTGQVFSMPVDKRLRCPCTPP